MARSIMPFLTGPRICFRAVGSHPLLPARRALSPAWSQGFRHLAPARATGSFTQCAPGRARAAEPIFSLVPCQSDPRATP